MNKLKFLFVFFLLLLSAQDLFAKDEVKDSVRTVTFYVTKDRKNISEGCEITLFRKGKKEKLQHASDKLGHPCFFFEAGTREIIRAKISHGTLGEMDTRLKCYWYNMKVDFFQAGEFYYHFLGRKIRLQPDSCLYRVSYGKIEYAEESLDVTDTILRMMKDTGIPFTKERAGLLRFHSEEDAVKMEKMLLRLKEPVRLEPKIIVEDQPTALETYLSNSSEIFFLPGTTDKQIKKIFRKLGIKTDYKNYPDREGDISYQIIVPSSADRSYMRILDRLWDRKEVYVIRQSILNNTIYMDYKLAEKMPK